MGKDATVSYSSYLCLVMASLGAANSTDSPPADAPLDEVFDIEALEVVGGVVQSYQLVCRRIREGEAAARRRREQAQGAP